MDFDDDLEAEHGLDAAPEPGEPVRTGVPRIDEVLAAVEELADRPVDEHVKVFEAAHEQLRAALEARPGPKPPVL